MAGHALIDAAARAAGRDPAAIRRIYNIRGEFTQSAPQPPSPTNREIVGPVEHWVEVLTDLALEQGFSSFILWTEPEAETVRRFIDEVAPAVRERVSAGRGPK